MNTKIKAALAISIGSGLTLIIFSTSENTTKFRREDNYINNNFQRNKKEYIKSNIETEQKKVISTEQKATSQITTIPLSNGEPLNTTELATLLNSIKVEINSDKENCISKILSITNDLDRNTALQVAIDFYKGDSFDLAELLFPKKLPTSSVSFALFGLFEKYKNFDSSTNFYGLMLSRLDSDEEKAVLHSRYTHKIFEHDRNLGKTWLLSLPDNVAFQADRSAMRLTGGRKVFDSINLLQDFLDAGKINRFEPMAAEFVNSYKGNDPESCVKWALNLPPEVQIRNDLIISSFRQLWISNNASAQKFRSLYAELQKIDDLPTLPK